MKGKIRQLEREEEIKGEERGENRIRRKWGTKEAIKKRGRKAEAEPHRVSLLFVS